MGTDLYSLVQLLVEIKEIDRLAEVVRRSADHALENVSHNVASGRRRCSRRCMQMRQRGSGAPKV